MSKLPKHIREIQALFRPRMDAQTRQMDALFDAMDNAAAEALRADLDAGRAVDVCSAEEFLRVISSPEEFDREMRSALSAVKPIQ